MSTQTTSSVRGQVRVARPPRPVTPLPLDLRAPSGRRLPF